MWWSVVLANPTTRTVLSSLLPPMQHRYLQASPGTNVFPVGGTLRPFAWPVQQEEAVGRLPALCVPSVTPCPAVLPRAGLWALGVGGVAAQGRATGGCCHQTRGAGEVMYHQQERTLSTVGGGEGARGACAGQQAGVGEGHCLMARLYLAPSINGAGGAGGVLVIWSSDGMEPFSYTVHPGGAGTTGGMAFCWRPRTAAGMCTARLQLW
jgi:hypothetical protein